MQNNYDDDSLRILVIGGSCFLPVANALPAAGADGALVADVASELTALHPSRNVLSVPLAHNHTTATLIREAVRLDPEGFGGLEKSMLRLAPTDLLAGLGQCATLGAMAWSVAAGSDGLSDRVYHDLLIPLWERRNGGLPHVNVRYISSVAGGAGSRTSGPMADFLARVVHDKVGSVVDVSGLLTGGMTFLGMGDRIFQNAAAGLAEQIAYTLDADHRHPLEVRSLGLVELPAASSLGERIGNNRTLRSALGSTLAASWLSSSTQARFQELRPNHEFGRRYGSIVLLRPSWYGLLSPEDIGAVAGRHYRREFESSTRAASVTPAALRVEHAPVGNGRRAKAEEWIERARQASGRKPSLWDEELVAPPVLSGDVFCGDSRLDEVLPASPDITSLQAFLEQGSVLRGIESALSDGVEAARSQKTALLGKCETLRRVLLGASNALFDHSWGAQMKAYLLGSGAALRSFRDAYNEFRGSQTRCAEAELDEQLLAAAIHRVRAILSARQTFAQRLCSMLDSLGGGVDPTRGAEIEFRPIESVFGELAAAAKRGNVAGIRAFLPCTAAALSLSGLARLIGADPDVQSISRRIAERPLFESPHWGGQRPGREPVLRLIVLPPVADDGRRAIAEAIARHNQPVDLVCADSLSAGASLVSIDIYEVSGARDLFPRPYRAALDEILADGELYALSRRAREFVDSMAAE